MSKNLQDPKPFRDEIVIQLVILADNDLNDNQKNIDQYFLHEFMVASIIKDILFVLPWLHPSYHQKIEKLKKMKRRGPHP